MSGLALTLKRGFLKGLMFQDAPLEAQPKCDDHSVLQRISLLVIEKDFLCDFAIVTNETLQKAEDEIHARLIFFLRNMCVKSTCIADLLSV